MHRRESLLERLCDRDVQRHIAYLAFAVLVAAAWIRNVNWDEFFFLSHIHANLEGRLDRPMQTAYVHAFGWLAWIPGKEMAQVFVARLTMTLFLGITCLSIYRISKTVAGRDVAGLAVLAFLTSGFVIVYGASFRADPIAAAGLMAAMAIMMTKRMGSVQTAVTALLIAASLLVTVKAVLYLPAFLGVLLWRWPERGQVLRIFVSGLIGVGLASIIYIWHASGIASSLSNETANNAQRAFETTLLDSGLFPRAREALLWALLSLGAITLVAVGIGAGQNNRKICAALAFALPCLLSILFYRNAFPYFFPFITPPLMIITAMGAARLGRGPVLGTLIVLMLCTGAGQAVKALSENAALQRATLAEVHRLFPEPVPYIDHNAMVATFPRNLFFMSSMGLKHYRAAGQPVMAHLIETKRPPLLLANRWALHVAMNDETVPDGPHLLFPEDAEALRQSYIHYSGTIWLAGQETILGSEPEDITLPFPGRYRVETDKPVVIDGNNVSDRMVIYSDGEHRVSGSLGQKVRFVWDTFGTPRTGALPNGGLYVGFWKLQP